MLSIAVPMYNEEALAAQTIDGVVRACDDLVASDVISDYELIVVDDGSTDTTPQILDASAAVDPHIRVLHHKENQGLGEAIRSAFGAVRGSLVLYMDGDLPFDLGELERACTTITEGGADVFSAYRTNRTSEGFRRTCYSFAYNGLVRLVFGLRTTDVNFAFKIFRREVVDRMQLQSEGSFIDAEMMILSDRLGYRIVQHGVRYQPRTHGISTLSSLPVILKILREGYAFRRSPRWAAVRAARATT